MSKEYLAKALADNCLPSALLFSGNGAKAIAMDLSATLLNTTVQKLAANNHLDFHCLAPEGKSSLHSIESIRTACQRSHEASFAGGCTIFLIESADRMQPAAANALLKTLEEPSVESTWILLSDRPQEILPTILSRCTRLSFPQVMETELVREEAEVLKTLLTEKLSYPKWALELDRLEKLIEGENSQQKAVALLTLASEHFHQFGLSHPEAPNVWEEPLGHIALALERNIKISTCFEYLFLKSSRN